MSSILERGHKIECRGQAGSQIIYLANFIKGNAYVFDTADATGSYTTVADNGGGTILVTTALAHNLVAGQVVTLSAGSYDGSYHVISTPSTTTFVVTAIFAATDAATWAWETETEIMIGTSDANGTALVFFKIEQESEVANVTETDTHERTAGTIVYEQSVGVTLFEGVDDTEQDALRTLVSNIVRGRFVAVAIGNDGVNKVYGSKNGLRLPDGEISTGTALGDLAGAVLNLVGKEQNPAFIYDPTGDSSGSPAEAFTAFTLPS